MRTVALGIDGGASTSRAAVLRSDGRITARVAGGPLNWHATTLETFRANLRDLTARALESAGIHSFAAIGVGTASLFLEATDAEREAALRGVVDLDRSVLVSDAVAALAGATSCRPGLLVIGGTGSIAIARSHDGRWRTAGGWGHILGDEGSAWWIATQILRDLARFEDGEHDPEEIGAEPLRRLTHATLAHFGVAHLRDLVPIVHAPDGKSRVASLAAAFACSPELAAIAKRYFIRAGRALAELSQPLWDFSARAGPLCLYLVGSVIKENTTVRSAMKRWIRSRCERPHLFLRPQRDAAVGAALLALERLGLRPPEEPLEFET